MKTLSLRVPDSLDKKLHREAKRRGTSKSALVKGVLESHFGFTNGKNKTVGELAGDLIGCLEGPGDLSHNPKYLEGYGT